MEKTIRVLARGLQVIDAIRSGSPASLAQLHLDTGLAKSTLLRVLHTLQLQGWVYRGLSDGGYRLSFRLYHLGDNLLGADALAEAVGPVLDALQRDLSWPSYVAVRRGLAMEVIERTRKKQVITARPELVGVQADILRSAIGHAYLAFCSDTERNEIVERVIASGWESGRMAADASWLEDMLQQVRQRGYSQRNAHDWPAPAHDLCAIAVPVILHGRIKACINIVWSEGSFDETSIAQTLYPRLRAAADDLSAALLQDQYSL